MVTDTRERGQAHTLEAILAAVLLVLSVVFALQVSAVTPMSESTASQHIENQQAAVAENLLDAAIADGSLKETILYWNDGNYTIAPPEYPYYTNGLPDDDGDPRFGTELNETLTERGIAYDLRVKYYNESVDPDEVGAPDSREVVDQGEPSDHAVTITRFLTLYADDELDDGTTLPGDFYVASPDHYEDEPIYNVIEVELVLWRM